MAKKIRLTDLVDQCENEFKPWLDRYKYADRNPEYGEGFSLLQCETFLAVLDAVLEQKNYLAGDNFGLTDAAIFPFIRQFRGVNVEWFNQSPYKALIKWLQKILDSDQFKRTMPKYAFWKSGDDAVYFPEKESD